MGLKKLLGKAAEKQAQRDVPEAATVKKPEEPTQSSSFVVTEVAKCQSKIATDSFPAELLEAILMFLPMKDMLISQRVARWWRQVIQGSKKLQQALFMEPREAEHAWKVYFDANDSTSSANLVKLDKKGAKPEDTNEKVRIVRGAELNPIWFTDEDTDIDPWHILEGKEQLVFCFREEVEEPLKRGTWMKYPEASWRKMLIIQPPVRSYRYEWKTSGEVGLSGQVQAKQNITVGDMVDKWAKEADEDDDTIDFLAHHMSLTTSDLICLSDKFPAQAIDWTCAPKAKS